jgi:hypothetical protein
MGCDINDSGSILGKGSGLFIFNCIHLALELTRLISGRYPEAKARCVKLTSHIRVTRGESRCSCRPIRLRGHSAE